MNRSLTTLLATATAFAALVATASAANLQADYNFEKNLKSSVGDAGKLAKVGTCGCTLGTQKINGKKQGVLNFSEGGGLRLSHADKVLGHGGKTYTIAMQVQLDEVSSYRRLVDFTDLQDEEGWYVYSESLYPYDLSDFDYSKQRIQAGEWNQIVLTRDGQGVVRGYVEGEQLGKANDLHKEIALKSTDVAHFLIDDGSEETSGAIARLRIWENALPNNKIKDL